MKDSRQDDQRYLIGEAFSCSLHDGGKEMQNTKLVKRTENEGSIGNLVK